MQSYKSCSNSENLPYLLEVELHIFPMARQLDDSMNHDLRLDGLSRKKENARVAAALAAIRASGILEREAVTENT